MCVQGACHEFDAAVGTEQGREGVGVLQGYSAELCDAVARCGKALAEVPQFVLEADDGGAGDVSERGADAVPVDGHCE